MTSARPSIEAMRRVVDYNPETGEMTWRPRDTSDFKDIVMTAESQAESWNERYASKPAFSNGTKAPYCTGRILGYRTLAHRVAFALHNGRWPTGEIDHINGDSRDNRIANLRDVSSAINMRNRKLPCTNRSGTPGVRWDAKTGAWAVTIGARETRRYLGSFKDLNEAVSVRKSAEAELGYHPNHGRTSHG